MRTLLLLALTVLIGCGDPAPPPPKLDADSIKASQDEQRRIATGEGSGK